MSTTHVTAEPGSHEVSIVREVTAPPALVYRAFVEPDLLAQWLGPRQYTMKVDGYEARHAGLWRFLHVGDDGTEHGFRGVFHGDPSVEAGITRTWEYEGAPGQVSLEHAEFQEIPGGTRIRMNTVYLKVEARDQDIANGMEGGVTEGFERMDELLERLR